MRLFKSPSCRDYQGLLTEPCEAQYIEPATSNLMWSPQLQATKDDDIPVGGLDGTLYQDFRNAERLSKVILIPFCLAAMFVKKYPVVI
jgi:hypothetical protein